MEEVEIFRAFIKSQLKLKKMTYKDLGLRLAVSEATVKRWLSRSELSVKKLSAICRALGVSDFEFKSLDFSKRLPFKYYSAEQEQFFSNSPIAFFIFIKLAFNTSLDEVHNHTRLSRKEFDRYLFLLEKKGFIELWPGSKIKIKHVGAYRSRQGGKLIEKYHPLLAEHLTNYFLTRIGRRIEDPESPNCTIWRPTELYLTEESACMLSQDLTAVFLKYGQISHLEKEKKKKIKPTSVILGVTQFDVWASVLLNSR